MREKIAQIYVFNTQKDIIEKEIKNRIMTKSTFMNGFEKTVNALESVFGKQPDIDLNSPSLQKGLSILCDAIDEVDEYVITENGNDCVISSEWFDFGGIVTQAENLLSDKEYDFLAVGTNGWDVFVAALYESGKISAKLVVGSYEDLHIKAHNSNLHIFDDKFNAPSGAFKALIKEKSIEKARRKFEQLTNLNFDLFDRDEE